MFLVNCAVEENSPIEAALDTGANVSYASEKIIDGKEMAYEKDDSNPKVKNWDGSGSYSTLGKVNLCISFNDGEKHKCIGFIVLGNHYLI